MKSILAIQIYLLVFTNTLAQPSIIWNESYTAGPGYSYSISSAEKDYSGNIIVAGSQLNNNLNDYDPLLIKYDPQGNLIFNWLSSDSINNEGVLDFVLDSLDNMYILSYLFVPDLTIPDTVKLIKIDGGSGQEIFQLKFTNEIYRGVLGINNSHIYLVCSYPNYTLYKFDLSGNQVWSKPLYYYREINKILFYQNDIYIVGDSVTSMNANVFTVEVYNETGVFQWKGHGNSNGFFNIYKDSKIDDFGNIWVSSLFNNNNNNYGKLNVIGNGTLIYDTIVGTNSQVGHSKLLKGSGNIYWLYNNSSISGTSSKIIKFSNFNSSLFATIDSIVNTYQLAVDFKDDIYGNIFVFNTKRGQLNTDFDYLINKFDSSGNLQWNLSYSNDTLTQDVAFKIFVETNYVYVVGHYSDFSQSMIPNVIKLDLITGINEVIPSDSKLNVFPNPMSGKEINFSLPFVNTQVSVIDIFGRTTERIENFSGTRISLPKKLSPGFYTLVLENPSGRIVRKIIVNE